MDKPRVVEAEAQETARVAIQIAEAMRAGAPLPDELEQWLTDLVSRAATTKAAYWRWMGYVRCMRCGAEAPDA